MNSTNHISCPRIEIVEQPAPRAVRFRYQSEGRPSSNLIGINSTKERPTFPKIRVFGLTSLAHIVVSCVTKDEPYRMHPHSLKNSEADEDSQKFPGIINTPVDPSNREVTFSKIKLQCVPKEEAKQALEARAKFPLNPFPFPGFQDSEISAIDLNSVRLCFQVITENPMTFEAQAVCLAVSEIIYDKKKFNALEICRLTTHTGSVAGGTELTVLCKKVAKNDVQVRFYEEKARNVVWEEFVDPKHLQFFKQISIKLRTPAYNNVNVSEPVSVYIQLVRMTDGSKSVAVPFQLEPLPCNKRNPPRTQNAAVMNLLDQNNCDCILYPILQPDCKIHGVQKENQVKNIMDERVPLLHEPLKFNVPPTNAAQVPIYPNFNSMSNLKSQNFHRRSDNMPELPQPSKKAIVPTAPVGYPEPAQKYDGAQQDIITKPLIKSLRKNFTNSDLVMREINYTDIEEVDSDTVYNNLTLLEQFHK